MEKKKVLKNEQGFTLIEIIAVIIIIGILAAVAVPKFFSMQEDAKIAALSGALAEAQARFNHAYAKYILDNKKAPTGITDLTVATYLGADGANGIGGEDIGDFKVEWRAHATAADTIVIYITEASTIPDMTGLDAERQTEVSGITWSS